MTTWWCSAREARRVSARLPAAIATGTSVTIATATPDTRERCHNDKPCAARRYGGPEPGNRCERFASRGAERSRVRETRIYPDPRKQFSATLSAINRDRACVKTERNAFEIVCFDIARELFTRVVLFLVALCFCSPAPRFSSVYYVDAFLPFRYESFRRIVRKCLLLRGSSRYYRSVIRYTGAIVPNCRFSWIFSSP